MEKINTVEVQELKHKVAILTRDLNILLKVVYLAGEYARKNPPPILPENTAYYNKIIDGEKRDPKGLEYIGYWFGKVMAREEPFKGKASTN